MRISRDAHDTPPRVQHFSAFMYTSIQACFLCFFYKPYMSFIYLYYVGMALHEVCTCNFTFSVQSIGLQLTSLGTPSKSKPGYHFTRVKNTTNCSSSYISLDTPIAPQIQALPLTCTKMEPELDRQYNHTINIIDYINWKHLM